ncbi:MAG: ABC transporter permease [Sphaerochaetaceae bacterium]|nr:ABC transporter permease [Sphaerochaetaceae bacterium]
MIEGIFVEGLIFSIMTLGILISYRILDLADLTCDGSVAAGAATGAMCIIAGWGIVLSMVTSFVVGVLCGLCTAVIHNKLKIPGLLAGILTMTMLYSINLRILGNKANVPLVKVRTLYRVFPKAFSFLPSSFAALLGTFILVFIIAAILVAFFKTDLGTSLGALGSNEQVIISLGMDPAVLKYIGLGLSNGLIALSGAMLAQYQGFADANLGQGMAVQGLAAIMLGEFLFKTNRIELITLRVALGSIAYKALMFLGRKYGHIVGITPNDFKLLTGLLVISSMLIAFTRQKSAEDAAKKKALSKIKEAHNA